MRALAELDWSAHDGTIFLLHQLHLQRRTKTSMSVMSDSYTSVNIYTPLLNGTRGSETALGKMGEERF